jgi:hypothetical protein
VVCPEGVSPPGPSSGGGDGGPGSKGRGKGGSGGSGGNGGWPEGLGLGLPSSPPPSSSSSAAAAQPAKPEEHGGALGVRHLTASGGGSPWKKWLPDEVMNASMNALCRVVCPFLDVCVVGCEC